MDHGKPYKIYGYDLIDEPTREQFHECLVPEWSVRGALMPDAHLGYTMPIGGVVVTDGMLVPSWVGYDIGCGVSGVQTTFDPEEIVDIADVVYETIKGAIPLGFEHRKKGAGLTWRSYATYPKTKWFNKMFHDNGGFEQLGTLGGGNHFIEIGVDSEGIVWVLTHSGSRNVGHKTATEYIKRAHPEGKCKEGSYGLSEKTQDGRDYFMDMTMCLKFAEQNRREILEHVTEAMKWVADGDVVAMSDIHCNHNLAVYSQALNGWLHRKGATDATLDRFGIIPGNMRDGCFVVRGLGSVHSLYSCSHGAGRAMSRKQAKKEIPIEKFVADMEGVYSEPRPSTLDESPDAYKSVSEVMKAQERASMLEIVSWIKPLINVKG